MDFISAKKIIDDIYSNIDGHTISYKSRKNLFYTDKTLVYGEILLDSFYQIIKSVGPKENEVFYDLGSGVGKAVFAARLLFPFGKSTGIELLSDIYQGSVQAKNIFEKKYQKQLLKKEKFKQTEFINKNIFDVDFSDGDVIFFHATCCPDQLMVPISKKLETLKKEARVIIVTRYLYSDNFVLQKSETHQMGWGQALVNFYVKK